jgi:hypothetical protein
MIAVRALKSAHVTKYPHKRPSNFQHMNLALSAICDIKFHDAVTREARFEAATHKSVMSSPCFSGCDAITASVYSIADA